MKHACVMLNADGSVAKVHCFDINPAGVSAGANDLESLFNQNYQPLREVPLEGGRVLLLLRKPY